MRGGPPRIAERIVALLLPPACREEVVGDLHERFRSPSQYVAEVLATVPLVIFSRIRRTADPQVLLIQAFVLYLSFFGVAWFEGARGGLLRLAVPVAMMMAGLLLDEAYANPGKRSALSLVRAPLSGVLLAFLSQEVLSMSKPDWALPRSLTIYGCAAGFLLSSVVRMLFPPLGSQLLGINVPAAWLKQAGSSSRHLPGVIRVLKAIAGVVVVAATAAWIAASAVPPKARIVQCLVLLTVLVVVYQGSKRA